MDSVLTNNGLLSGEVQFNDAISKIGAGAPSFAIDKDPECLTSFGDPQRTILTPLYEGDTASYLAFLDKQFGNLAHGSIIAADDWGPRV